MVIVTQVSSGKPADGVKVRPVPRRLQLPGTRGDTRGSGERAVGTPDRVSWTGSAPFTSRASGPGVDDTTVRAWIGVAVPVPRCREEVLTGPDAAEIAATERAPCSPWWARTTVTIPPAMTMAAVKPRIPESTALPLLRPASADPGDTWAAAWPRLNNDISPHDLRLPIAITQCNQRLPAGSGATRPRLTLPGTAVSCCSVQHQGSLAGPAGLSGSGDVMLEGASIQQPSWQGVAPKGAAAAFIRMDGGLGLERARAPSRQRRPSPLPTGWTPVRRRCPGPFPLPRSLHPQQAQGGRARIWGHVRFC